MYEIGHILPDPEVQKLVDEEYRNMFKGCVWGMLGGLSGKSQRRKERIAELMGLDPIDVNKMYAAINIIGLRAKTKADSEQELLAQFTAGMGGAQTTGSAKYDMKVVNWAILAKTANEAYWRERDNILSRRTKK